MPPADRKLLRAQIRDGVLYWLLIPGAVIGAGLAADRLLRLPALPVTPRSIPVIIIAAGLGLITLATRELAVTGRGTPNPGRPPKSLVQSGVYRLCRHPMFLGYDLAALGVILFFASTGMLCISFPVFLAGQVLFLRKEERLLAKKFRTSHGAYRNTTPFLLPFLH